MNQQRLTIQGKQLDGVGTMKNYNIAKAATVELTVNLQEWTKKWAMCTHGNCKDNTSKDPFSQCENLQNLQGIHIQVKSEYVALTTSEVMTRMQSDKHNNMFNVAANLKHVETHENINWRLVSFVDWTTAELVCLQCLFLVVGVVLVCCTVPCLHNWSHCGSSLCLVRLIVIAMSHAHVVWLSPTSPSTSLSFSSFLFSSCTSHCLSPSSTLMSWITATRTAAEELGHPDNKNSSTGYEPNDHFITEAYVEFTQESVNEQRFPEQRLPEDFDYDDITIGQTFLKACRRRADHSEGEGLSSSLSSSSTSHDRTGKPVVCRDASHAQGHEIQRQSSESEQIRTLLDRQREQILADCQAEIRKHEFQADYDRRSIQKLNETLESQQEELHRAQAEERRRQDHQLLHVQLLKQNWDLREAHEKSLSEMEEFEEVSEFYLRHNCEKEIGRRSRYYSGTYWQDTGIAKWSELYERFQGFSRCWISTQWTFPRCQSTSVIPSSSNAWRNAMPFFWNAEPQRRAAKHLGHAWYIGKRFCRSSCVFYSTLSAGIESMEYDNWGADSHVYSGEEWESNTSSRSEMPVWTVSQKFSHLQWTRLSKELWGRPTTTSDFRSSFWQILHTSNVRLLEDKIQDWGMYLLVHIFPTEAMQWTKEVELVDSVDDSKSSSSVRGIRMPDFEVLDARIASALNRIIHNSHFKRRVSLEEQKSHQKRTVSFTEDRLLTWSTSTSGSLDPMIPSRITPTYSLVFFEMMIFRNSILSGTEFYCRWRKSHMMTSWKDCTN